MEANDIRRIVCPYCATEREARSKAEAKTKLLHDLLTKVEAKIAGHPDQRIQTGGITRVVDDLALLIERERKVNKANHARATQAEAERDAQFEQVLANEKAHEHAINSADDYAERLEAQLATASTEIERLRDAARSADAMLNPAADQPEPWTLILGARKILAHALLDPAPPDPTPDTEETNGK